MDYHNRLVDHPGPYTVQHWGRVYGSNGPVHGLQSVKTGLDYRDVCEQVVNAARRDTTLSIVDINHRSVSLGMFQTV